jgi:hypothetical protein
MPDPIPRQLRLDQLSPLAPPFLRALGHAAEASFFLQVICPSGRVESLKRSQFRTASQASIFVNPSNGRAGLAKDGGVAKLQADGPDHARIVPCFGQRGCDTSQKNQRREAVSRSNASNAGRSNLPRAVATACRLPVLRSFSPPKRSIKSKSWPSTSTG